jgi:hypothetical protein
MAGDEVNWMESLWAPLIVLSVPFMLFLGLKYYAYMTRMRIGDSDQINVPDEYQDQKATINPMQSATLNSSSTTTRSSNPDSASMIEMRKLSIARLFKFN